MASLAIGVQVSKTLATCAFLIGVLASCGSPTPLDVADAYLGCTTAEQAASLFSDNAVKIDVNGNEYDGGNQIRAQLAGAFSQISYGELVEAPHIDGDHVTWVRVNFDRLAARAFNIRQNIWVSNGKIVRFTGAFADKP